MTDSERSMKIFTAMVEAICECLRQFADAVLALANSIDVSGRVIYLACHAKKCRVRKKNLNRIRKAIKKAQKGNKA